MNEKNWDAWKDHDRYVERALYREEAERDQIETKPMPISGLFGKIGYKEIHVRGVFVGGCPETYIVRLRLGDYKPMVSIKTPEGVISFIANLEEAEDFYDIEAALSSKEAAG